MHIGSLWFLLSINLRLLYIKCNRKNVNSYSGYASYWIKIRISLEFIFLSISDETKMIQVLCVAILLYL